MHKKRESQEGGGRARGKSKGVGVATPIPRGATPLKRALRRNGESLHGHSVCIKLYAELQREIAGLRREIDIQKV